MIGLNRLVGIMMAGGLTASQSSTMQDMGGNMLDVVRVSVTQYELAQVRTAVATECIFGGKTKVLKDFPAFVRDNMSAKGRDPGTDFWETLYWAEEFTDQGVQGIDICSSGPDKRKDSDDDICVEVLLK